MRFFSSKRIYLDYASTTPVRREVRKVMSRYWSREFYNPSSLYSEGRAAKDALENSRQIVASVLGARKREIVFTSGGTESDNLAILGTFEAYRETHPEERGHLVVSSVEHRAVLEAAEEVKRRGGEVSYVPADESGYVAAESVMKHVRPDTFLVSLILVQNEIGTIEPVSKLGRLIEDYRRTNTATYPLFHTDASQAPCFLSVSKEALRADLITIDGSKIYAPKGVGMLFVRGGMRIRPIVVGGGQESGLRSGTESLALISGFAEALSLCQAERDELGERLYKLRSVFVAGLEDRIPDAVVNGGEKHSAPHIVSVSMEGVLAEMLLLALDRRGVMVSAGSACSGPARVSGSHVLRAMGRGNVAESTVRFSFGRGTTRRDVEKALRIFQDTVEHDKIRS